MQAHSCENSSQSCMLHVQAERCKLVMIKVLPLMSTFLLIPKTLAYQGRFLCLYLVFIPNFHPHYVKSSGSIYYWDKLSFCTQTLSYCQTHRIPIFRYLKRQCNSRFLFSPLLFISETPLLILSSVQFQPVLERPMHFPILDHLP